MTGAVAVLDVGPELDFGVGLGFGDELDVSAALVIGDELDVGTALTNRPPDTH